MLGVLGLFGTGLSAQKEGLEGDQECEELYQLAKKVYRNFPDSAKFFLAKGIKRANLVNDKEKEASMRNLRGIIHKNEGDLEAAMEDYEYVENYGKVENDLDFQGLAHINKAVIFKRQLLYDKALNELISAVACYEETGEKKRLATCYNNIGNIYRRKDELDESLLFHEKALAIRRELDDIGGIGQSMGNFINIYMAQGKWEDAESYAKQVLQIRKDIGDKPDLVDIYISLAFIEKEKGNLDGSKKFLNEGRGIAKEINTANWSYIENKLGEIYLEETNYEQAVPHFKKAIELSEKFKMNEVGLLALKGLSEAYSSSGNYQSALDAQKKYQSRKDTIDKILKEKDLQIANEEFAKKQQQDEINRLNKETKKRNKVEYYLILALITLCILAGFAIYTNGQRNRAYQLLREEKQQTEELLESLKNTQFRLLQSEKMASIGQLTAGIAHEINNPVNFVANNVEALKMDIQDMLGLLYMVNDLPPDTSTPELKEIVETKRTIDLPFLLKEIDMLFKSIEKGTKRTTEIVNSLRYFSREDRGEFSQVDVHDVLNSSLAILQNFIKSYGVFERDFGDVPFILGQPGKLSQVFLNILNNAAHSIKERYRNSDNEKGWIRIRTEKLDSDVRITVSDNGNGMEIETLERIFEPFFSTKPVGEGTGLGLSISYAIIQQHNGKITVDSSPGQGAIFTVDLPFK